MAGSNGLTFNAAPVHTDMNLCNMHFHENPEHKGEEFTQHAGNGDGHGYHSSLQYSGTLTPAELSATAHDICRSSHGGL
ncbi:MAG: hypothetical protein ACI93R_002781 [Flavobacteriales bacterium]|jgi:hypothetical protein